MKKIDRSNWRAVCALKVRADQAEFVATPHKSLAACFIRPDGDNFIYSPMAIYAGDLIVGYVTTAVDPSSTTAYWIADIMIDADHQGNGYGRQAVSRTIEMLVREYPRCEAVRLTCFRRNRAAAELYTSMGFRATGAMNEEFGEPNYELSGAALAAWRRT